MLITLPNTKPTGYDWKSQKLNNGFLTFLDKLINKMLINSNKN